MQVLPLQLHWTVFADAVRAHEALLPSHSLVDTDIEQPSYYLDNLVLEIDSFSVIFESIALEAAELPKYYSEDLVLPIDSFRVDFATAELPKYPSESLVLPIEMFGAGSASFAWAAPSTGVPRLVRALRRQYGPGDSPCGPIFHCGQIISSCENSLPKSHVLQSPGQE